jgi:hypothetical protein
MKKATKLEVEIYMVTRATPIQAQACFTFTTPINCFTSFSVVWRGPEYYHRVMDSYILVTF